MKLKIFGILGVIALLGLPAMAEDDDFEYVDIVQEEIEEDDDFYYDDESEIPTDETRTVSARMTCAEINERLVELREDVKKYPELEQDLEIMLVRWRGQCASRTNRRPARSGFNTKLVTTSDDESKEEIVEADVPVVEETVVEVAPEKTAEEIEAEAAAAAEIAAENLARGLCADGTKPNKYGCCAGYKFKEVSQMKFACCPPDGDCVEPIVKK